MRGVDGGKVGRGLRWEIPESEREREGEGGGRMAVVLVVGVV